MNDIDFTIKNKPITFKAAVAYTVTSVALALCMILVIIAFKVYLKVPFIWFIEVIPAAGLCFSVLQLVVYYKEEFSLKDGEFRYIKFLKKPIIFKVAPIACVYLRPFGHKTQIEFVTKKNETVATIFDDGTVFQDGKFLSALEILNIKVKGNGYVNK